MPRFRLPPLPSSQASPTQKARAKARAAVWGAGGCDPPAGGLGAAPSGRFTFGARCGHRVAAASLSLPRALFYHTLSEQSGFSVGDDGDLMSLLTRLAAVKAESAARR